MYTTYHLLLIFPYSSAFNMTFLTLSVGTRRLCDVATTADTSKLRRRIFLQLGGGAIPRCHQQLMNCMIPNTNVEISKLHFKSHSTNQKQDLRIK